MPPHETLFLESTRNVDIQYIAHNNFLKFQTWDFGGDMNLSNEVVYDEQSIPVNTIFTNCSSLIYVIDAQEDDYEGELPKLVETIAAAHEVNKNIHFEVFLHKLDGFYLSEEIKVDRQQVSCLYYTWLILIVELSSLSAHFASSMYYTV